MQTYKHICTCAQSIKPHIIHGHPEEKHTAATPPPSLIFSYCFLQALCTWHVLQIHKGVGEELGKGDPGIWISLQQPQQKVSAVLGDPGPWRELMHKTWPYNVALHQQDNPREKDSIFTIFTSLLFIKR